MSSDSNSRASTTLLPLTHPGLYLTMATFDSVSVLISTAQELKEFLSTIFTANTLYIDLEGKSLSRNGTICVVSILVHLEKVVRLIDVTVLGQQAFTTATGDGKTLKSIPEDSSICKCI
jgi:exonuclease 3'-5' domain-containing protein 1